MNVYMEMCVHNVIKDTHVCKSLCILGIEELFKEAGNDGRNVRYFLNIIFIIFRLLIKMEFN